MAEDSVLEALQPKALELTASHPYELLTVHWGVLVVAFPMFGDLVWLIGKMCKYQDEFTGAQPKLKILDKWGERSAVAKGSKKMLASLNAIRVIQRVKQGRDELASRVDADEGLYRGPSLYRQPQMDMIFFKRYSLDTY